MGCCELAESGKSDSARQHPSFFWIAGRRQNVADRLTPRILRGLGTRNTVVEGSDNRDPNTTRSGDDKMNKKQLMILVQTLVLSTAASINQNATDGEPDITEDEARTLFAMRLRKATKTLVADAAGCEEDDVVIETFVPPKKKAKEETADADAS